MAQISRTADQVANAIEVLLREQGPTPGATIGHMLRREFPDFRPTDFGAFNLRMFIERHVGAAAALSAQAGDIVWALAELLDERQLARALAAPSGATSSGTMAQPMSRLQSMEIAGWRAVKQSLTLPLRGLTVLIGANGVGKSSLLFAIDELMASCRLANPTRVFQGARSWAQLHHYGAPPEAPSVLAATGDDGSCVRLELGSASLRVYVTPAEGDKSPDLGTWTPTSAGPAELFPAAWRQFADGVLLLRLSPEALLSPSPVEQTTVDYDGYGLASTLAHLANTEPELRDQIVHAVQKINPRVEGLRQVIQPASPRAEASGAQPHYRLEVKVQGAGWVPARLISEGTLLALGVHTALLGNRPRLLLLDDIDHGLHPRAQRAFAAQLQQWVEEGAQILTTTHSPVMLDAIAAEDIVVVHGGVEGTKVRPLTEHPKWAEWCDAMSPGEFWTWVGEDWLDDSEEPA
jgi:ABC-type branched-subunit amino acid transport system ATPase component